LYLEQHCGDQSDTDLPSVMTCVNYIKLPPYSSKVTTSLYYFNIALVKALVMF